MPEPIDWSATNPGLPPPFDVWPRWALHLDAVLAYRMADVSAAEGPTRGRGLRVAELQWMRGALASMAEGKLDLPEPPEPGASLDTTDFAERMARARAEMLVLVGTGEMPADQVTDANVATWAALNGEAG